MKYDPIPVTPAVIRWARDRAGFSIAEASEKFKNLVWFPGHEGVRIAELRDSHQGTL